MKNLNLALSALLLAAPLAQAAPQSSSSPSEVSELEQLLDEAVTNLERSARARGATREQFERVYRLLHERAEATSETFSRSEVMRDRLSAAVQQIEEAAREAWVDAQDFAALQEQIVDERLDRALEELERHVRARGGDRTTYERVSSLFHQRAEAAQWEPDADDFRQRMQNAIDNIVAKARSGFDTSADFHDLQVELVKDRVRRAAIDLQRMVRARGGDRTTYQRLLNLLLDRAEIDPDYIPGVSEN